MAKDLDLLGWVGANCWRAPWKEKLGNLTLAHAATMGVRTQQLPLVDAEVC